MALPPNDDKALSSEESRLYNHIVQLTVNRDTPVIRPLTEEHLLSAIGALQLSTSTIEKQTDLLKSQQRKIQSKRRPKHDLTRSIRSHALELQQLYLAVEEESQYLDDHLESALQDLHQSSKKLKGDLETQFSEDDATLQTLSLSTRESKHTESDSQKRTSALIDNLVDFTVQEAQVRLDRVYLERLGDCLPSLNERNGDRLTDVTSQEDEVTGDLNSLRSEISDVVTMCTSSRYEAPFLRSRRIDLDRRERNDRLTLKTVRYMPLPYDY